MISNTNTYDFEYYGQWQMFVVDGSRVHANKFETVAPTFTK